MLCRNSHRDSAPKSLAAPLLSRLGFPSSHASGYQCAARARHVVAVCIWLASSGHVHAQDDIKRDPTEMKVEGNDYASVRTFVVPVVKQDQVVAYALVNLGITFAKLEELDRVWTSLPKIRHDIFMYLFELLGILWTPTATPDRDQIKKKVEEIFKKHAEGVVKSISIGNIEIHQTSVDGEDGKPFFVPQVASP